MLSLYNSYCYKYSPELDIEYYVSQWICMFLQVVSESGLFTPDDVAYVQNASVFAVSFLSH